MPGNLTHFIRHMLLGVIVSGLLAGFAFTATAKAPDAVEREVPQASLVGSALMRVLLWDVYTIDLHAPGGTLQQDKPYALTLTYLRSFDGRDIADRSVEEMRGIGYDNEVRLAAWHQQMQAIFPDVQKGESLTGIHYPNGKTVFYAGDRQIGSITDPDFGRYFFGIWLDPATSEPKLREQLLGAL